MKYVIMYGSQHWFIQDRSASAAGEGLARAWVFDDKASAQAALDRVSQPPEPWHILDLPQAQALETLRSL